MTIRSLILTLFSIAFSVRAFGQISPGELSRGHEKLEGVDHCTKCHEQGEEITGKKCLECHAEIRDAIAARHGFHFQNASGTCVNCHKEHLGRNERITQFDKDGFDHRKTGFALSGNHAALACEKCHTENNIKDPIVARNKKQYPHLTYLGLRQECNNCHVDRHAATLGSSCQNCHSPDRWKPAPMFSHAKTKYPLTGKHEELACIKCHETLQAATVSRPVLFSLKSYDDCSSCHTSPHGEKFSHQACRTCHSPAGWNSVTGFDHSNTAFRLIGKHNTVACEKCHTGLAAKGDGVKKDFTTKPCKDCTPCHTSPHAAAFLQKSCSSCHTPQKWTVVSEKNFDHGLTSFPLRGRHSALQCSKCHVSDGKQAFKNSFKLTKKICSDCHEDKHRGQFTQSYKNDCAHCHSEDGYSPSTFTFAQHSKARFLLSSSHLTVPCRDCHVKEGEWSFRFDRFACESCHKDRHEGLFVSFMKDHSCEVCHTSAAWKSLQFDHSTTSFSLIGQHTSVPCVRCHAKGYQGTSKECADCHTDPHAGQFADKGKTDCARCHTPVGRRASVFRHDVQSVFALTGAHAKVECGGCHKPENRNGAIIVRYKPLSTKCESCHQGKM